MVYNYTKPRGPVAAMEKGPGPSHSLPSLTGFKEHDPRSIHTCYPAYQFGLTRPELPVPCSPGPCHFPDARISRTGRSEGRYYSLYPRISELKKFSTPAPGTYEAARLTLTGHKAPAYSFGVVCPPLKSGQVPGPNAYSAGGTLGRSVTSDKKWQSSSYSIYGRSKIGGFDEDFCKTPGPGAYGAVALNKYRKKRPEYSLTGRNVPPGDATLKPGPGAHSPEQVNVHLKIQPKFSFGIKHSDYEAPLIVGGVD